MFVDYANDNDWFNKRGEFWLGGKLVNGEYEWRVGPLKGDEVNEDLWATDEPKGPVQQICIAGGYTGATDAVSGFDNANCGTLKYALCEAETLD